MQLKNSRSAHSSAASKKCSRPSGRPAGRPPSGCRNALFARSVISIHSMPMSRARAYWIMFTRSFSFAIEQLIKPLCADTHHGSRRKPAACTERNKSTAIAPRAGDEPCRAKSLTFQAVSLDAAAHCEHCIMHSTPHSTGKWMDWVTWTDSKVFFNTFKCSIETCYDLWISYSNFHDAVIYEKNMRYYKKWFTSI